MFYFVRVLVILFLQLIVINVLFYRGSELVDVSLLRRMPSVEVLSLR